MRTAFYCRFATDGHNSVAGQMATAETYRREHQLAEMVAYVDAGVSGLTPLADRPAGSRLIEEARSGAIDCVIVLRWDRLARDASLVAGILAEFEALGVRVRSMTEPPLPSEDEQRDLLQAKFGVE